MLSYYILIIAFMYKLLYSEYVLRILVMGPGVLLSLQDLTHVLQVGCAEKITDESTKEKEYHEQREHMAGTRESKISQGW